MIDVDASPSSRRSSRTMRPEAPLLLAMLLVVASFALSLAYSHFRLQPVTQQAVAVLDDAAPSIEHLSAVRTELTRIGMYVTAYVSRLGGASTPTREDIRAAHHRLDVELDTYRALPSFPEEVERLAEIYTDLALFDEATQKALDEADAGSFDAVKLTMNGTFHARLHEVDEAVALLKTLSVGHARTSAELVLHARRDATLFATILGTFSLLVAIAATILALRVLRGRARLMEDHARVLAARATELEAFAGRVAHDLKDPLGAVALRVLTAARQRDLDPKLRDTFDRVARQVERMDHIITGLLEFARAGANPPPGARADLGEILEEVASEKRPAADAVGAELQLDAFSPAELACTPGALTSVLSNLLGNAVKYIAEGKQIPRRIAVHVKEHAGVVRVEVEDNGPGLPPGSEARVFEPFYRLTMSKQPGIGLGLATVKKIVEAYKGRIGVDSKPDDGSTFWFELPKAPAVVRPPPDDARDQRGHQVPGASA